MQELITNLVSVPVPLIFVLLLGHVFFSINRRVGYVLLITATGLLSILCLPITSVILTYPLTTEKRLWVDDNDGVDAVVVPTAGIFQDPLYRWWSNKAGLFRGAQGYELSLTLDVPLIISGGSPRQEPVSEAEVLMRQMRLSENEAILETKAANSWDTAAAVSDILIQNGATKVLIVTSPPHLKRMAAALRANGLGVLAPPPDVRMGSDSFLSTHWETKYEWWLKEERKWRLWLPSANAMGASRAVLHEYIGIMYYIITGRIQLNDLRAE